MGDYMSIQQLADRWGVHPSFVRRKIRDGVLSVMRASYKVVLIPVTSIRQFEEDNTHVGTATGTN